MKRDVIVVNHCLAALTGQQQPNGLLYDDDPATGCEAATGPDLHGRGGNGLLAV